MRDIRNDLRERLENIDSQRRELQERLGYLVRAEERLRLLLDEEESRWKGQQPSLAGMEAATPSKRNGHTLLGQFIMDVLSDGKEWSTATLAELAKGRDLVSPPKKPGRVVHFTLVAMKQHGLVEKVGPTSWRLKGNENGEE